jgi:hypothetical protein
MVFAQAGNESVAPFGEPMGTLLCPPWETPLSFLKVDLPVSPFFVYVSGVFVLNFIL